MFVFLTHLAWLLLLQRQKADVNTGIQSGESKFVK